MVFVILTIDFFTCVNLLSAVAPVVHLHRMQLAGVPQLLSKEHCQTVNYLMIFLGLYGPVLGCYLPAGTTVSLHVCISYSFVLSYCTTFCEILPSLLCITGIITTTTYAQ
jgi:hypothetical protein